MEGVQAAWEGLWFGYPQSRKQGRRLTVDAAPIALLTMCAAPASPSPASQSSACSVPCFKLDQFSASQSQPQVSNTSSFHHPMFSTSPVSIAIISRCAQFQFLQLSTSPVFFYHTQSLDHQWPKPLVPPFSALPVFQSPNFQRAWFHSPAFSASPAAGVPRF
jgi:hypothetical protein